MTAWLRTRRAPLVGAVALATIALLVLVGGARIPVPSLAQAATFPIVAAVFLPLLVNSALQYGFGGRDWRAERSAVRRVALLDVALVLSVGGTFLVLGAAAHAAGMEAVLEGARNAIGYVGLGLIVALFAGPRAASTAPAAYVVFVAAFSGPASRERAWSWPVHEASSVTAAVIALALFAGGTAALLVPAPRATSNEPG